MRQRTLVGFGDRQRWKLLEPFGHFLRTLPGTYWETASFLIEDGGSASV